MTTAEQERKHWRAFVAAASRAEWECGEPWATAPTVGWLMQNAPICRGQFVDLGCGSGRLAEPMARAYPGRHVVGVDFTAAMDRLLRVGLYNVAEYNTDGRTLKHMVDGETAFVWSVATFQHLDAETVVGYIDEAARVLTPGGVLAVQFVEGGAEAPFHHSHSAEDMAGWIRGGAGLRVTSMSRGWLLPEWTWMTARKMQ